MKRLLLLLPLLAACTSAEEPLPDTFDPAFSALVLHGPFDGEATLTATDSRGEAYDGLALGLPGSDWDVNDDDRDGFWLLGRLGTDVVRRYAWPDLGAPTLEFSAVSPSNPQVAAECGDALFVSRYDVAGEVGADVGVWELDGTPAGRVPLDGFGEGTDGNPEASSMVEQDGVLYVGLQRLDRDGGWVADPVGTVVAIDCATRGVVDSWETRANVSVRKGADGTIWARGDGGLQRFDGDGFVDVLTDDDLPAPMLGFAATDPLIVHTEDAGGANALWCVDDDVTLLDDGPARVWSLRAGPDGTAWASWRDHWLTPEIDPGGLAIYDAASCAEVARADLGSDPFAVAFTGLP